MESFYLILSYIIIGLLLRRVKTMPENTSMALNAYVLNVALPALILKNMPLLSFSSALYIPAITPWFLLVFIILLTLFLSKVFNWSREVTGALLIILPLGNTSFLGFPVTEALFGQKGMPYAVVYDQLGSFIALATYATIVAAMYSSKVATPNLRDIVIKIVTFPSFVALILGLGLRGVSLPDFANSLINGLSLSLVPVVMVAVGFQLSFRFSRTEMGPMITALSIKLMLMPAVAWLLWYTIGESGLAVDISIFQAAMPPMISAGAIAIMAGLAPRLVSGVIGFGVLLALVTLPIVAWLLG
ncbi:MAG: putative permease [Oleiphilaceae bacterium]|jgi:predicted permease